MLSRPGRCMQPAGVMHAVVAFSTMKCNPIDDLTLANGPMMITPTTVLQSSMAGTPRVVFHPVRQYLNRSMAMLSAGLLVIGLTLLAPPARALTTPAIPWDLNGDGYAELAIGAWGEKHRPEGSPTLLLEVGRVTLFRGTATGPTTTESARSRPGSHQASSPTSVAPSPPATLTPTATPTWRSGLSDWPTPVTPTAAAPSTSCTAARPGPSTPDGRCSGRWTSGAAAPGGARWPAAT